MAPSQQGIVVLGTLLGTLPFIQAYLDKKAAEQRTLLDRIPMVTGARDNTHSVSCVVPSLRSGWGPECATQDEDRGAARETGAQSEHGLLLMSQADEKADKNPLIFMVMPVPWGRRGLARRTKWSG